MSSKATVIILVRHLQGQLLISICDKSASTEVGRHQTRLFFVLKKVQIVFERLMTAKAL